MNTNKMYVRIRNVCGVLGMCLPWLALISGALVKDKIDEWWYSISVTYYITPALAAVLTAAAIVLMTYDGYDLQDNIVTTISGVFGLGIVLFPCSGYGYERVGFFQIPESVSNTIHYCCAVGFFGLLTYNCLFLFTKTSGEMTEQKKKRNVVYRVCGIGMICSLIIAALPFLPGFRVMIAEILALQFFGVAWITKGETLFPDKE